MIVVRLEDWAIETDDDPVYVAPQHRTRSVIGLVYGHPRKPDGDRVRTSRIVEVDGRRIQTSSGTVYHLGEINKRYLEYMTTEMGFIYDPDSPIKGWK